MPLRIPPLPTSIARKNPAAELLAVRSDCPASPNHLPAVGSVPERDEAEVLRASGTTRFREGKSPRIRVTHSGAEPVTARIRRKAEEDAGPCAAIAKLRRITALTIHHTDKS